MHAWKFSITFEGNEIIGLKTQEFCLSAAPIKHLLLSTLCRYLTAPAQPSQHLATKIETKPSW